MKGTAGWKSMRIFEEQQCDEKKIDSKVGYLEGTTPGTPTKTNPAPDSETDGALSSDDLVVIFSTSNLHSSTD